MLRARPSHYVCMSIEITEDLMTRTVNDAAVAFAEKTNQDMSQMTQMEIFRLKESLTPVVMSVLPACLAAAEEAATSAAADGLMLLAESMRMDSLLRDLDRDTDSE